MSRHRYYDAAEIVERYSVLTEQLSGSKAQDLIAMKGEVCALCFQEDQDNPGRCYAMKTKEHDIPGRQKFRNVCTRCDEPWEGRPVVVFKGKVSMGRNYSSTAEWLDDMQDEYRHLRPLFESRPRGWEKRRWEFARFCAISMHFRDIGSVAKVVQAGLEFERRSDGPGFGGWWTQKIVRYWYQRFMDKIEEKARRAGLVYRRSA